MIYVGIDLHRKRSQIAALDEQGTELLRMREDSRLLSQQLDVYLHVIVDGMDVRYDVRTIGAQTSGRYRAERWREVNQLDRWDYVKFSTWKGSRRRRLLAIGLVVCGFLAGVVLTLMLGFAWRRLRKRSRAS